MTEFRALWVLDRLSCACVASRRFANIERRSRQQNRDNATLPADGEVCAWFERCVAARFSGNYNEDDPLHNEEDDVKGFSNLPQNDQVQRPGWKPYFHKGKQEVLVQQRECITCVQYDSSHHPDCCSVSGVVRVEALLDGLSEVSLVLNVGAESIHEPATSRNSSFSQLPAPDMDLLHHTHSSYNSLPPTLTTAGGATPSQRGKGAVTEDQQQPPQRPHVCGVSVHSSGRTRAEVGRRIAFVAPLERIDLLTYSTTEIHRSFLPFRGYLQMKEINDKEVRLFLQLKLSAHFSNGEFDFCRCTIPFPNRSPVHSLQSTPTFGAAELSSDKHSIVWNLGKRLNSRNNRQFALHCAVEFDNNQLYPIATSATSSSPAPVLGEGQQPENQGLRFCQGVNCFADLSFRLTDATISNMRIDRRDVTVRGNKNVNVEVMRVVESSLYRIWNGKGRAITAPQAGELCIMEGESDNKEEL